MAQPKTRPATYADIVALPENMVDEILFGALHAHPRPAPRHSRATSSLGIELGGPFDRGRGGPGGWIILDEPELHLGEHVVVLSQTGNKWLIAAMFKDADNVQVQPFEAHSFALDVLWPGDE